MSLFQNQLRSAAACRLLCLSLLLVALIGCGKAAPTAMVSGKVTVKGKQLTNGTVIFYDAEGGGGATCPIDADGNYQTKEKLYAGSYTVAIGPGAGVPALEAGAIGMPPPPVVDDSVPKKFTSIQTSDLKTVIEDGENTFDVQIP
ncbi:MAG: hypothetical protein NXI22_03000 [bacterium]|nr:hypothetical protein [bacterium]